MQNSNDQHFVATQDEPKLSPFSYPGMGFEDEVDFRDPADNGNVFASSNVSRVNQGFDLTNPTAFCNDGPALLESPFNRSRDSFGFSSGSADYAAFGDHDREGPSTPSFYGNFNSFNNASGADTVSHSSNLMNFWNEDFKGPMLGDLADFPFNGNTDASVNASRANLDFDSQTTASFVDGDTGHSVQGGKLADPFYGDAYPGVHPSAPNAVFDSSNAACLGGGFNDYEVMGIGIVMDFSNSAGFGQNIMPSSSSTNALLHNAVSTADSMFSSQGNNNAQASTALPMPGAAPAPAPTLVSTLASAPVLHRCNFPTCTKRFKRPSDLLRHRNTVHLNIQGHLCPITNCPKARGNGYSRADKVTEHLWKKHGDLGCTKA